MLSWSWALSKRRRQPLKLFTEVKLCQWVYSYSFIRTERHIIIHFRFILSYFNCSKFEGGGKKGRQKPFFCLFLSSLVLGISLGANSNGLKGFLSVFLSFFLSFSSLFSSFFSHIFPGTGRGEKPLILFIFAAKRFGSIFISPIMECIFPGIFSPSMQKERKWYIAINCILKHYVKTE